MALSFQQIRELISSQLNPRHETAAGEMAVALPAYCYIEELYADQVIFSRGSDFFKRSYAITDESTVTFGDESKVLKKISYEAMKASCQFLAAVEGEDADGGGKLWNVRIIEFGLDKNKMINWPADKLTAAIAKFDGAKVFALRSGQHTEKAGKYGKAPVDLVGVVTKPEARHDGIYGQIAILPSGNWISENLTAARGLKVSDPYGLSVDIDARAAKITMNGKSVLTPIAINKVTVDIVYDPAAGGEFLQLAACEVGQEGDPMLNKLLAAVQGKRPDLHKQISAGLEAGTMTEDQAVQMVASAIATEAGTTDTTQLVAAITSVLQLSSAAGAAGDTQLNEVRLIACGLTLDRELENSQLPLPTREHIRKSFTGKLFAATELSDSIRSAKEMLDALTTGGGLVIEAGQLRASHITDQRDKLDLMLDDFFDGKVNSFKACYQDITGDLMVTGRTRDARRLTASIESGTFAEFLGDSITRRALREYNASGLDSWKQLVDIVPLADFRTNHRPRMGGYGDLPIVEETGSYDALSTPSDEEATYAPAKRGGTEIITMEAIKNDDVGLIRKVPVKLGRSSARTLYKFVFAFLSGNPAIYDGVVLFHSDHGNLGTAALEKSTLQARRLAMMKQQEQGSDEPLGISPLHIIVPVDLEDTAYELTAQPNLAGFTPAAADSIRRQTWNIIPVKHWTDTNNWYLAADKADLPLIEVGFLDGKQEPEFFVQDMPNVGSMFSNDMLTYKIRHIYGGNLMDFRGFQGSIVT